MKQQIRVWVEGVDNISLYAYINNLIIRGFIIILVIPMEYKSVGYDKVLSKVIILVSKEQE